MSSPARLRVGIDVREWVAGRRTGIGRYLSNLVGEWTQSPADVEPLLYANVTSAAPPGLGAVVLRRLPEPSRLWWDQVSLPRALARDRAHAFLSPYYKAPLRAPCPVVITIHDLLFLDEDAYRQRGRRRVFRAAFVPFARAIAARAAAVVTDSEHSRDCIVRLLGVPPRKVRVVPIGLPAGHRRVEDTAPLERVRARYGLRVPYLLYVGNFKPHKNLPRLLRAFAALPDDLRAPYQLVLAGARDASSPGVETEVRRLGIAAQVRLAGFVDDEDLPALYTGATALLLPSLSEGFGIPVIEAMACGTPVVCSNVAPLRDVAGDAAVLVDPHREPAIAAGLAALLADEGLRRRLAARGERRAQAFTAAASARTIAAVLREAVEGGAR